MKKLFLSLALVAAGVAAYAQKPAAGDKTAEVSFTGAGLNSFNYTTPELRFRYFASENMAYRLRLSVGSTSSSDKEKVTVGGSEVEVERKVSSGFMFNITPGVEWHLAGTSKLSPYYGAQLNIGLGGGGSTEWTNALGGGPGGYTGVASGNSAKTTNGTMFGFGLSTFMGADYYITDGIFVGGEFGLGLFAMTSTGEGENSSTTGGTTTTTKTGTSGTTDILGVTSGNVRLGFKF